MSEFMSKEEMEVFFQKYDYFYFYKVLDQIAVNNIIFVDFFFDLCMFWDIFLLSLEEEINFFIKKMINCVKI